MIRCFLAFFTWYAHLQQMLLMAEMEGFSLMEETE